MTDMAAGPLPIPDEELHRRWKAVREIMKDRNLDFLIFQNSSAELPGYVKWFTDISFGGFNSPTTAIFPRDDDMTVIRRNLRSASEPTQSELRGVRKQISVMPQVWTSLTFASTFDAEKVVEELGNYKNCRIGWVGLRFIPASFYRYVTENLTAQNEDVTGTVERLRALKSDAEISLIKETCALEDKIFEYALTVVKPGETDAAIKAKIVAKCKEWGALSNIDVRTAPPGEPARYMPGAPPRTLQDGDQVIILIETSSPTCYWGELGRTICIGRIPAKLEEQFELAKEAQQISVNLLKPGAAPKDIWEANDEFVRNKGYLEGRRLYAHGQGYDIVESPSLEPEETMKIEASMFFAVHPEVRSEEATGWLCDNYLIKESGKPEWFHMTPQKIFVV